MSILDYLIYAAYPPLVTSDDLTACLMLQLAGSANMIPVVVGDEDRSKVEILPFQSLQNRKGVARIDYETVSATILVQVDQVVPKSGNNCY